MNQAPLNPCLRILDHDRTGGAFEVIHAGNHHVLHAATFEFGENREPELGDLVI